MAWQRTPRSTPFFYDGCSPVLHTHSGIVMPRWYNWGENVGLPRTWATTQLEAALSPPMTLVDHVAGPVSDILSQAGRKIPQPLSRVCASVDEVALPFYSQGPAHCTSWTSAQLTIGHNESGDLGTQHWRTIKSVGTSALHCE